MHTHPSWYIGKSEKKKKSYIIVWSLFPPAASYLLLIQAHTCTLAQKGHRDNELQPRFCLTVADCQLCFFVILFCQVCYIFVTGPLKRPWCSLLKCKLIKVNSSSLKLNHFKADWLPRLSLLVHFSFALLAHPHFQKDYLPFMWNCQHFHNRCRGKGANCGGVDVTNAIWDGSGGIN